MPGTRKLSQGGRLAQEITTPSSDSPDVLLGTQVSEEYWGVVPVGTRSVVVLRCAC